MKKPTKQETPPRTIDRSKLAQVRGGHAVVDPIAGTFSADAFPAN
jgi:hypothetical protein